MWIKPARGDTPLETTEDTVSCIAFECCEGSVGWLYQSFSIGRPKFCNVFHSNRTFLSFADVLQLLSAL